MTLFIDSGRTAPRSIASPGARSTLGPAPRVSTPIRSAASPGSFPTGRSFAMPTFDPSLAIPAVDPATMGGGDSGGSSGGGGGGGWSFDTDPGYQMALAQEQSGLSSIDANLRAARERAIEGFGDPALAGLAGFGLDPQAADFARQNYLSGNATLARLDKEKNDKRRAIINALAGRGILESGDLGYLEGQASQTYGQNVYDARNKVLDYLRDLDQQAQDRRNALRQSVVAALQNAFASGAGGPGGGGGGGGGFDPTDFQYGANLPGGVDAAHSLAVAAAPQGATPMHVMNQGMTQDGRTAIKYRMPDGTTSTFWVGPDGSLVPA